MNYIIQLTNKKTGQIFTKEVYDLNEGEKLYYKFPIDLSEMENGEYDLELTHNNQLIIVDTLYIGNYQPNSLQYKRGENTYIEILFDTKLQDEKQVIITDTNTVVKADDEFDAIKRVVVDATPLYENAYEMGNKDGYETGVKIQKELLETLTVTENGTYTKENGYNEVVVNVPDLNGDYQTGFDEGYSQGYNQGNQAGYDTGYLEGETAGYDSGFEIGKETGVNQAGEIIAETAQVLNITENGIYGTTYSKWDDYQKPNQITGVFDDGKEFYNYAVYTKFKTNIIVKKDTRLEFWIKDNNPSIFSNDVWVGYDGLDTDDFFYGKSYTQQKNVVKICGSSIYLDQTDEWRHIIMSVADGLIVNGEKIGDFNSINDIATNMVFEIGLNGVYKPFIGMIKINNQTIIPNENGLLNITTGEYLEYANYNIDNIYEYYNIFTEPIVSGNLIKTVNVNVQPKVNVAESGLKFGQSTFNTIPEWADFSDVTDMSDMFYQCYKLKTIPLLDTSKVTNMQNMFHYCNTLTEIPLLNTSNVTNMKQMFNYCQELKAIPNLDTSKVTDMESMFARCNKLTTIPPINTSNVKRMQKMFDSSKGLVSLPAFDAYNVESSSYGFFGYDTMPNLTDVGGWINLRAKITGSYGFEKCPNLTYQSCINILNGLYDFTGNGETPTSNQGQLKVHQNFLNLVGDEISIATTKGWVLSA